MDGAYRSNTLLQITDNHTIINDSLLGCMNQAEKILRDATGESVEVLIETCLDGNREQFIFRRDSEQGQVKRYLCTPFGSSDISQESISEEVIHNFVEEKMFPNPYLHSGIPLTHRYSLRLGQKSLSSDARAAITSVATRALLFPPFEKPTLTQKAKWLYSDHSFKIHMGIAGALALLGPVVFLVKRLAFNRFPACVQNRNTLLNVALLGSSIVGLLGAAYVIWQKHREDDLYDSDDDDI